MAVPAPAHLLAVTLVVAAAVSAAAAAAAATIAEPRVELKLMPLGDSITLGVGDQCSAKQDANCLGGYRRYLYPALRDDTTLPYAFRFVGSHANGPPAIDVYHEGVLGETVLQLYQRLDAGLLQAGGNGDAAHSDSRPDVVLLHSGTNDAFWPPDGYTTPEMQAERAVANYALVLNVLTGTLIGQARARADDAAAALEAATVQAKAAGAPAPVAPPPHPAPVVLVATILPLFNAGGVSARYSDARAFTAAFNRALSDAVVKHQKVAGDRVRFRVVEMNRDAGLVAADVPDGMHPNNEGYTKMARVWHSAIAEMYRKPEPEPDATAVGTDDNAPGPAAPTPVTPSPDSTSDAPTGAGGAAVADASSSSPSSGSDRPRGSGKVQSRAHAVLHADAADTEFEWSDWQVVLLILVAALALAGGVGVGVYAVLCDRTTDQVLRE